MAEKANQLDHLDSILLTQLVILPDPVTGKLYKATVGELLAAGAPINLALKADLVGGKVPASQLPSYVDDVIEYATVADLPTIGEVSKIYVITSGVDANKEFRWSGSMYIQVGGPGYSGADVADEAATRAAADIVLQNAINAETLARQNADNTLQSNINTEAATRAGADTTLQTNINSEATARGNADTTLQANINAEVNARTNADGTERNARIAADNAIIAMIGGAYEIYTGIAGENLGGGKLVYLNAGKFYLYNANDTTLADAAFGITQAAAVADAAVTIQLSGVFTEVGMGLTPGAEYYADINGLVTTTPTAAVYTFIGIAITADSLKLNIQQSIITI